MIRKNFAAETKTLDGAQGLVETVFSVTGNVDRQQDVIEPGAFVTALGASRPPTVVYGHQWDSLEAVLGKTVEWQELKPGDPRLPASLKSKGYGGVRAVVKFDLETEPGRLAFTHVKNGNLPEWSFAFEIADGGSKYDEKGIRHISAIREVMEISLVLMGANQDTATVGFKAYTGERRERVEDALEVKHAVEAWALTEKDDVPILEGDEAAHNGPIADGLDAINTLISQELAEGYPEYDCIIQLCCIAREIIAFAQGEAQESVDYDVPEQMAAKPPIFPAWMAAGLQLALTPDPEPVTDNTTPQLLDHGLMQMARAQLRRTSN